MRRRTVLGAAGAAIAARKVRAQAGEVDLLLVLAVDASGSIDADEFRLQREGLAEAVTHPAVLAAVRSQPIGAIGIAMVEWGTPGGAETVMAWEILRDAASAARVAELLRTVPRSTQSYNAIGDAILHAQALIQAAPWRAAERVIDVSGDGPDLRSLTAAPEARDAVVAAGTVVNGLAIELSPVTRFGESLGEHYRRAVIGGPGAFVLTATDRRDFARAMRTKLVREIS
ncbi:DUF1194 domain-containing protein [Plastoroseomonas arctica]|uniref:DUF1194 domain-containing protein n=1 Tax=Plastoroseomonas arctica TaxID=1509237 RepID=A0AAF1KM14_9PROT|nr:DUF1194 domain-containing protein [Plastoroseomonas arctica]MBR0655556.1 DUF1194 domain-containing protein [Plastoroseomonas arctica]